MNDLFPVCIVMICVAFGLVLIDWYILHRRYAFSHVPNIVNRVFVFFCLAMLSSNVIMVAGGNYASSLYVTSVVVLTETVFLCSSLVKK